MAATVMEASYKGTCVVCGEPYPIGTRVYAERVDGQWTRWHVECHSGNEDAEPPPPPPRRAPAPRRAVRHAPNRDIGQAGAGRGLAAPESDVSAADAVDCLDRLATALEAATAILGRVERILDAMHKDNRGREPTPGGR